MTRGTHGAPTTRPGADPSLAVDPEGKSPDALSEADAQVCLAPTVHEPHGESPVGPHPPHLKQRPQQQSAFSRDPVRLYLSDIARLPLLNTQQERIATRQLARAGLAISGLCCGPISSSAARPTS